MGAGRVWNACAVPLTLPYDLTWDEVDPGRHRFDRDGVGLVVASCGPARSVPDRAIPADYADPSLSQARRAFGQAGAAWAEAMAAALVGHYGPWVCRWRWAVGEGDLDGGPISSWCCPQHSITSAPATLERVAAAVREWREWLEHLARWFEAYPLDPAAVRGQRALWEAASRALILRVVERTGCESGWYGHCELVLTWFLSRWGVEAPVARRLVEEAVGGRFESWVAPDGALVDDVAGRLAAPLDAAAMTAPAARVPAGSQVPDHLRVWSALRETIPWAQGDTSSQGPGSPASDPGRSSGPAPVPSAHAPASRPGRDVAAEDIKAFDGAIDPARAEGLLAALELARVDAVRGAVLDVELMARWQRHVLGTPGLPAFRTLPAFAKGGRERYGIEAGTRERFERCLAESGPAPGFESGSGLEPEPGPGHAALPVAARAVRAYLDVCFFHPFDDGNGRLAFLTLVFVLAREGWALGRMGLLRRRSVPAGDPQEVLWLVRCLDMVPWPAPGRPGLSPDLWPEL